MFIFSSTLQSVISLCSKAHYQSSIVLIPTEAQSTQKQTVYNKKRGIRDGKTDSIEVSAISTIPTISPAIITNPATPVTPSSSDDMTKLIQQLSQLSLLAISDERIYDSLQCSECYFHIDNDVNLFSSC